MDLTKLRIIYYPDPRLRKASKPLETIDQETADLARRMFELMYEVKGLGLAAPQVGINTRLFVANTSGDPEQPDCERVYINPEIVESDGTTERDEGCLSLPDVYAPLQRAKRCRLTATGLDGQAFEEVGEDLLARAWQHEMDHLDGILILDRMSPAQKIANRRLLKQLEQDYQRISGSGAKRGTLVRRR